MSDEASTIIQGYLKRMQDEYENFNTVYNDLLTKLNLAQTEYTKKDDQFKKLLTDETNLVTIYSSSTRQNFNTEFEKVQSAAQAKILNISQVPEELDEFIKLANLDLEGVRNQLNEISQNVAAIKDEANAQIDSINRELPKVTEAGQKAIEDMNKVVNQVTASGQTLQQQINELDLRLSGIVNNQSNISKDITAIQETNKAINASQEALLKLIDKTDDRIDQINQQIGDIVKLRTDIDTLETEKADKTFVDAQLAQKVKKDELVVNVKDYGAKGDGVTNDTQAIQNALNTGKKVFIPKGTYMVSNLIPKGGQVIFGENAVDSWGTSIETSKTILKGMGGATDYVIKNRTWDTDGNPYPVVIQELTIDGNTKTTNGIRCGNSTTIERCRIINCIDGIVKVDVSRVTNCQIVNNTNGIREATDSKIDSNFIYQNDIGIYLINSNDNMVSSNKIEWNGVGIDISTSVFNLITGNIIDRQTTFGITSDSTSYITVTNNQFERNLTNHVLIQGSYWNVTGNSFYKKNSEDDMSGTLVPVSAIELKSASNCTFSANMVFGNKMFSSSYEYVSSNTFSNNAINGGSEVIKVSIPATTLAVGESKTLQIAFPVNYGTTSGWDVEVKKYKLATDSMTNYYQYNGVEIYIHNNNGVYVKLTNNFSTEKTFSGTIWLDHITWSKR